MDNDWIAYVASEMKWEPAPEPWRNHTVVIASLWAVGYSQDTDYLLAISATGRGVFDCLSGDKLGRDRSIDYAEWRDKKHLTAKGIPPIADEIIRTAGDYGGGRQLPQRIGWRDPDHLHLRRGRAAHPRGPLITPESCPGCNEHHNVEYKRASGNK